MFHFVVLLGFRNLKGVQSRQECLYVAVGGAAPTGGSIILIL